MARRILTAGTAGANSSEFVVSGNERPSNQRPVSVLVGGMESGDDAKVKLQIKDSAGSWVDVYEETALVSWSFESVSLRAIYSPGTYRCVRSSSTGDIYVDIMTPKDFE